jgi:hypothetical protein
MGCDRDTPAEWVSAAMGVAHEIRATMTHTRGAAHEYTSDRHIHLHMPVSEHLCELFEIITTTAYKDHILSGHEMGGRLYCSP